MTAPIVLAFSGGLDTSYCVPWLAETYARPVVTVTVDTGGFDASAVDALRERALSLGAQDHLHVDKREAFFDEVLRYLIMGNVRRGQLYPLCVGAERGMQARELANVAKGLGAHTVAHGCTAAGNDQVRFEVALRTLAPELEVLAPVRDHPAPREHQLAYLAERGHAAPPTGGEYSINRGLWGTTIGGKETLDSKASIPESAWVVSRGALDDPLAPTPHTLSFTRGVPTAFDGEALSPVALIEQVEKAAAPYGIGRGVHLGDTVLGTKGRVAFEAPAAEVILTAHRELEKLTLTGRQSRIKESVSLPYGDFVHEGHTLDPVCRDIETLLESSQARVTGDVNLRFHPGHVFVEGVTSPHSLLAATRGVYGEAAGEWTADDALGYSKILSLSGILHQRAGNRAGKPAGLGKDTGA